MGATWGEWAWFAVEALVLGALIWRGVRRLGSKKNES
jgi:hypothetical protein